METSVDRGAAAEQIRQGEGTRILTRQVHAEPGHHGHRRPELGKQKGPVSLREAYSTRCMDDMLQYDDARRCIETMQRRIFDSVELQNSGVINYGEKSVIGRSSQPPNDNSGVVNYGAMGNVQNQPGTTNSHQNQTNAGSGPDQLKEFTAQQRLGDTGGRTVARATLEQILTKCDGIPGLVSLVSSALSLIATFA